MIKNKSYVIALVLIFCATIIVLAHFQFFSARETTIELYSQKQLVLAKQVALSTEKFFEERINALELVGEKPGIRNGKFSRQLREYKNVYHKVGFYEAIIFLDSSGNIINSYPEGVHVDFEHRIDHIRQTIDLYKSAKHKQTVKICEDALIIFKESLVCVRVPVYNLDNTFAGMLIGIIDLNKSLDSFIRPALTEEGVHLFIISSNGTVIYHPKHPEMIHNNIFDESGECLNCHRDFSIESRMVKDETGWGRKTSFDNTDKLLSFARINLPGISWSLAIDTPYRMITEANSKQFWMFFILSFLMIIVVVFGSLIIYRINNDKLEVEKESQILKTRAKLLENIEEAEAKYRSLVEQSPDAIALVQNSKFVFVNEKFISLFGYTLEELNGESLYFYKLISPDCVEEVKSSLHDFVFGRRRKLKLTITGKTKTKEFLDLEVTLGRFLLGGKIAYQLVVHDITEMKIREREDSRQKHLAFIGEMSTRIAHEIKNPLASLQAGIQLVESNLPDDEETHEYFSRLTGEVHRVDRIVKGLLSYAREEHLSKKNTNIAELVTRVVDLNKQSLNEKHIDWSVNINGNNTIIYIDPQKMEQVFWNLIVNSVQAITDKGNINILIKDSSSELLQLVIADNGEGISAENQEKIFQPFFSTKSQGTGLGLAISKKIISAHGGQIAIKSERGKGTKVYISLPRQVYG